MTKQTSKYYIPAIFIILFVLLASSCKSRRKMQKCDSTAVACDSLTGKCKLDFKTAKALIRHVKENEFSFDWLMAKANVETLIDGEEKSFDIRVRMRHDSLMLITIQALSLVDVAKVWISRDSVKLVDYIHKTYFVGDFNYINEMLNADLDFEVLQAVFFGNSAEFYSEDESKLKSVIDRQNCQYLLSTERKRRLKRIKNGDSELKKALQTLTLHPENFKILRNEFIDPSNNRTFTANYKRFVLKDSVYAPYHVDIDIVAEKKANVKIEYVRIEKNVPQKLSINIPPKYDPIEIPKKQK
jgi:hypothetical protein